MATFAFLGVLVGGLNTILLAVVIFILKQPDPQQGRQQVEMQELSEKVNDLAKHVLAFEKKMENLINETKAEHISKLDRINSDVGRQLKSIHDNL